MRTIEESIAVLERWRSELPEMRRWKLYSSEGNDTYAAVDVDDSLEGGSLFMSIIVGKTITEALDRAASAVEQE